MSKTLQNLRTPKIYRGLEVDDNIRQKIRKMKQKVLNLEIDAKQQ